jgi:DNA-binding response OmpR family regulator
MRILIIEDEPQLARHVNAALARQGHTASVEGDGAAGLKSALTVPPDLIVLDVNLPTMDGFEVLAGLRAAQSSARVLMLTSRGEVGDRVKGLKAGADDYIPKPFAMDELIARVEALGRRAGVPEQSASLQVADLHVNVPLRRVLRAGMPIALSPREFELLQVLMQEPGRFFARTELYDRVWQQECSYDSRTVEMFITRLRKKIDADYAVPLIHTLRNVGYTIRAPQSDRPSK